MKKLLVGIASNPLLIIVIPALTISGAILGYMLRGPLGTLFCLAILATCLFTVWLFPYFDKAEKWAEREKGKL